MLGWPRARVAAAVPAVGGLCIVLHYFTTRNTPSLALSSALAAPSAQTLYSRPGTLLWRATLDGSDKEVPVWTLFNTTTPDEHGRLLEHVESHLRSNATDIPPHLSYLEGQTILIFGDSNERKLVDDLCPFLGHSSGVRSQAVPSEGSSRWHSDPHVCDIEALNAVFVHYMTYGVLVPDDDLWGERKKDQCDPPYPIFDRISLAEAFLAKIARKPSLIVFSSSLWDLLYASEVSWYARHEELAWSWTVPMLDRWIVRYVEALAVLRLTFPSVPLVTRNLHPLAPTNGHDFWNEARISDLNEAAEVVWRLARVDEPIDLHRILRGQRTDELLADKIHLDFKGGLYIYTEMILDRLKRLQAI